MKKIRRYRMVASNPNTIHEVFTLTEIIDHVTSSSRPWEVHQIEKIAVVHFLN